MEGSGAALSIDGSRTNDGSDVRREKRDEQDHRPNVPALGCIGIQHLGPRLVPNKPAEAELEDEREEQPEDSDKHALRGRESPPC